MKIEIKTTNKEFDLRETEKLIRAIEWECGAVGIKVKTIKLKKDKNE